MTRHLVGVDVGGTFTDFVTYDEDTKTIDIWNPSHDWCINWGVQYLDVWADAS